MQRTFSILGFFLLVYLKDEIKKFDNLLELIKLLFIYTQIDGALNWGLLSKELFEQVFKILELF